MMNLCLKCRNVTLRFEELTAPRAGETKTVSFQWKNPDFRLKNADLPFRNPDFLLKSVDFIIKQVRDILNGKDLGSFSGEYTQLVRSHAVAHLVIR